MALTVATTDGKVFVANLPADVRDEEIKMVFNTYGNCVAVDMVVGQGCAFVTYDTAQAAESSIATLNGVYSFRAGQPPINVAKAIAPDAAAAAVDPASAALGAAPGVTPEGAAQQQALGQAQFAAGIPQLAGLAGQFGQPHLAQPGPGAGGLLAQPMTTNLFAASAAAGGVTAGLGGPPTLTPGVPTKLFVGNLPQDIQQDAVRMVFGHYGTVTHIHIMQGRSRSGQACCFVEYSTPLEAETAILTLHEKYEIRPGEGNIVVKYASQPQRAKPY